MEGTSAPIALPQPDEIPKREREDAMGAYLMMFAAWGAGLPLPLLNLLAAVIYFFTNKKTSRFVSFHAYQSLLTQIPTSIINASAIAWIAALIIKGYPLDTYEYADLFWSYIVFVVLLNLVYMIFSIVACIRARRGRFYYFWVFGRIAFARYYGPSAISMEKKEEKPNLPPEGF